MRQSVWHRIAAGLGGGALVLVVGAATGCSSSSTPAATPGGDGGACTGTADLYHRLGCEPGITTAVTAIATAELGNADIASYFAYAGTPGHPAADQIEACLVKFISNAVGGPDAYPTSVTTTSGTFMCRSMAASHADLYISGGSFDEFLTIAANTLMSAGVAAADLTTIGGALSALKPTIVNPVLADAGLETLQNGISEADAGGGSDQ